MSDDLPVLHTERLMLKMPQPDEASILLRYYLKNKEHLANSGPAYAADYFEEQYWVRVLHQNIEEFRYGESARFYIYEAAQPDVVGTVALGKIMRRAAQFCFLGYGLDRDKQGLGYMSESVEAVVRFGFEQLNLHRIMANYVPHNQRSGNVLRRLGFVVEGYARDYLFLNNRWQDHILTARINPVWKSELA